MSKILYQNTPYSYLLKILFFLIFLLITNAVLNSQEQIKKKTQTLNDGTTIIKLYNETNNLAQEDIILRSGRHKTTYFDDKGKPKYGVIRTGTGSFGLMYYNQEKAPLFKFWDYSENDKIIQFYSSNFEPMEKIVLLTSNGERRIVLENKKQSSCRIGLYLFLAGLLGLILGFFSFFLIGRKYLFK